MKKNLVKIIAIIFLFVLIGFAFKLIWETKTIKESEVPKEIAGISMTIKEGTLTNTNATIIINNENDSIENDNNVYDAWFRIDKKIIGKWRTLKETKEKYKSIEYWVDPNNQSELNFDWISKYGELKRGHYRFVKKINNEYIATEFTIE